MFSWFKKKEPLPSLPEVSPPESSPNSEIEMNKLSTEQKIELISAQIEAISERIKNIERMVEEIYKIAKT